MDDLARAHELQAGAQAVWKTAQDIRVIVRGKWNNGTADKCRDIDLGDEVNVNSSRSALHTSRSALPRCICDDLVALFACGV